MEQAAQHTEGPAARWADEGEFRSAVGAFLAARAPRRVDVGEVAPFVAREVGIAFQRDLFDAGLAGLTVPVAYGGAGLDRRYAEIFNEEAAGYWLPSMLFTITLGMCVPVLLEFGTEEQKRRHIPPMLQGREIWCQMFSEPGAGSDVASLQTRAVADGDQWILNGQKVWTSGAHYAAFGMCIARTDPAAPKHRGLSMFIVPMDAPGVEVRPLVIMTGEHTFNEVFCTDLRIPAGNLVGTVNDGWRAALAMLMNERVALGASGNSLVTGRAAVLVAAAVAAGRTGDPLIRQALADITVREEILRFVALRVRAAVQAGRAPGPEGSITKLAGGDLVQAAAALAVDIAGADATAWPATDEETVKVVKAFLHAPCMSIAGGTSEIQRNIIAERLLGLPKEPPVG